jgi:hypothetical protein
MGRRTGFFCVWQRKIGYDVLVTIDRGLETQQNLRGRRISVLILKGKSGRLKDLVPLVPDCLQAHSNLAPGRVLKIER